MKHIILFTITIIFCSCKKTSNPDQLSSKINYSVVDSLTKELNEIYNRGHIYGFSVAIVNHSETIYQRGFGLSDIPKGKKYTHNSIQNIASISKTLIGIALLKAQEMNKLQLDDPINKHLPFEVKNPHYPDHPITIRHLATHTSSLVDTDYYDEKVYILKDSVANTIDGISENLNPPGMMMSLNDLLKKILSPKEEWYGVNGFLDSKPGERFEYSNIGASLAALVLENATGKPYDEFTTEQILKPLDMKASGWSFDEINMLNHSKLYTKNETEIPFYSLVTYPDGGLITSANDLGIFLNELIKGKLGKGTLLSRNSYQELFTEQLNDDHFIERDKEDKYNDEYNSGIFMGYGGDGTIGHTGFDPGVASLMFFDPETNIGKLLIINSAITTMDGLKEFYAIMDKLGEFETSILN